MKAEIRHMSGTEVAAAVEAQRVPVVPVATLETHGPHLPIEVDTLLAEEVVVRAARSRPDLLLAFPPIHYGYTEHTMEWPGGFSIRPQVLVELYYDIAESIARNGFRRILFVNGHGSNSPSLHTAVRLATLRTPAMVAATSWWLLARDVAIELRQSHFPGGMAHGCELETSAMMEVDPDSVATWLVRDCHGALNDEWFYSDLFGDGPVHLVPHWSQTSQTGVEGEPSLATAAKGRAILDSAVERLISFCEHFRKMDLPPVTDHRPQTWRWDPDRH